MKNQHHRCHPGGSGHTGAKPDGSGRRVLHPQPAIPRPLLRPLLWSWRCSRTLLAGAAMGVVLLGGNGISTIAQPVQTVLPQNEANFPQLVENLRNGDATQRREAALQLSRMGRGAKFAVPALIAALDDSESQVWFQAVTALSRIGPDAREAVPALIRDLNRGGRYQRQRWYRSAHALGQIGVAALPDLLEALESQNTRIRSGAAKAITWIHPHSPKAIDALINCLHDEESEVCENAAEAIGKIGPPALPSLESVLLTKTSWRAKSGAAHAAYWMGEQAAPLAPLMAAWLDAEPPAEFVVQALPALIRMNAAPHRILAPMLDALLSENEDVHHAAVNALLLMHEEPQLVVTALNQMVSWGNLHAARRAAYVLGRMGEPAAAAIPMIITRIRSTKAASAAREDLTQALERLGAPAVEALLNEIAGLPLDRATRDHWAVECLVHIGSTAQAALVSALQEPNPSIRQAALIGLENLGSADVATQNAVAGCLKEASVGLRTHAMATALAVGVPTPRLVVAVEEGLRASDPHLRLAAAKSAAQRESLAQAVIPRLVETLADPNLQVRLHALKALGVGADKAHAAIPPVIRLLQATFSEDIALAAVESLGKMGREAEAAVPAILARLPAAPPKLRGAIYSAIVAIHPQYPQIRTTILKGLQESNDQARLHAFQAAQRIHWPEDRQFSLAQTGLHDAMPAIQIEAADWIARLGPVAHSAADSLFPLLDNPDTRDAAMGALRRIQADQIELFVASLNHPEAAVRLFACESLGALGVKAKEAVPALQRCRQEDDYGFVRRQAAQAIRRINGD